MSIFSIATASFLILGSIFVDAQEQIQRTSSQPPAVININKVLDKTPKVIVAKHNNSYTIKTPSKQVQSSDLLGVKLGSSRYDLQTNASLQNRIYAKKNESKTLMFSVWMGQSNDLNNLSDTLYSQRGTHVGVHEVKSATEYTNLFDDWARREDVRTGWPTIIPMDGNNFSFTTHAAVDGTTKLFLSNVVIDGNGVVEDFNSNEIPESESSLWARTARDGKGYLHTIYTYQDGAKEDQVAYRRSTDGGSTWSEEILIPRLVSQTATGAGADSYAIAANGDKVAIIWQYNFQRIFLTESADNGTTWSISQIFNKAFSDIGRNKFYWNSGVEIGENGRYSTDTLVTAGNQMDAIYDKDGNLHVAFSTYLSYNAGEGTRSVGNDGLDSLTSIGNDTIFAVTNPSLYKNVGLGYWTSSNPQIVDLNVALPGDESGWDGVGTVISNSLSYGAGFSRFPNFATDDNGNIYLAYTSVKTSDMKNVEWYRSRVPGSTASDTTLNGLFGHIYIIQKTPSTIWSKPFDMTPVGYDCLYGSLADQVVDGKLFVAYQVDRTPGVFVTTRGLDSYTVDVYNAAIETSSLNPPIVSVEESTLLENGIFPNPANNIVSIQIPSDIIGKNLTIKVQNVVGQTITNFEKIDNSKESYSLDVAHLPSGLYQVIVESSDKNYFYKMIVNH